MQNKHLMLILSLLLLFAACKNKNSTVGVENIHNPATAGGISDEAKAKMPVITFEKITHDFGPVIQGERVSYTFKFTNTGKSNLVISSTNSTCGCTTSAPPQTPIKPGETGEIKVTFDSRLKHGVINNQVLVAANTYPATTLLRITADVKEP
jgi:hypothetical protein